MSDAEKKITVEFRGEDSLTREVVFELNDDAIRATEQSSIAHLNLNMFLLDDEVEWVFKSLASELNLTMLFLQSPGRYGSNYLVRGKLNRRELDLTVEDIEFAKFLASAGLPDTVSVRISLETTGVENRQDLFNEFRSLNTALTMGKVDRTLGLTNFELFIKAVRLFGLENTKILFAPTTASRIEYLSNLITPFWLAFKQDNKTKYHAELRVFQAYVNFLNRHAGYSSITTYAVAILLIMEHNKDFLVTEAINKALKGANAFKDLEVLANNGEPIDPNKYLQFIEFISSVFRERHIKDFYFEFLSLIFAGYGVTTCIKAYDRLKSEKLLRTRGLNELVSILSHNAAVGGMDDPIDWILEFYGLVDMDEVRASRADRYEL